MFTGIVTAVGRIAKVERQDERFRLWIESPYDDLELGDSVAVAGACLTVVQVHNGTFAVDAIVTTRGRTRLADLGPDDAVNLERPLAVGERLGGHFVQGHVDGVGTVSGVRETEDALLIDIRLPPEVAELSIPHGSIAVDGVSMTINAVPAPDQVQIAVIPFTREHTTLGRLGPGDPVHLEGDMLGKFVRQLLQREQ